MTGVRAFSNLLLQSCLWGGLATVLLGLTGAAVAGADAVRRIDGVTDAIQRIVRGDLTRRLPTLGGRLFCFAAIFGIALALTATAALAAPITSVQQKVFVNSSACFPAQRRRSRRQAPAICCFWLHSTPATDQLLQTSTASVARPVAEPGFYRAQPVAHGVPTQPVRTAPTFSPHQREPLPSRSRCRPLPTKARACSSGNITLQREHSA